MTKPSCIIKAIRSFGTQAVSRTIKPALVDLLILYPLPANGAVTTNLYKLYTVVGGTKSLCNVHKKSILK